MPISRRRLIASFGLAPALALLPRAAFAKYPDRHLELWLAITARIALFAPTRWTGTCLRIPSELPDGPIHWGDRVSFAVVGDLFKHGKLRAVAVRLIDDEEAR
jgi:hypothetical protein